VGVDPSRVALERAGRAHPELELAVPADGGRLPFTDSDFDAAVCLNVLQHVADTQSLLSELRRVLKPRGVIAIAVPWYGRVKGALLSLAGFETLHDPLEPVLRHYTPRSLRDLLDQLGFEQVAIRAAGGAPLWHRTLLARARRGGLGG
jgi:ubiquinone/menaquinone biosynthesis C-methylase UbiE